MARRGPASSGGRGVSSCGVACRVPVRYSKVWRSRSGELSYGQFSCGIDWHGMAVTAWNGVVRSGSERFVLAVTAW